MSLNPAALSLEDAARVLSKAGKRPITADHLQEDVARGAPVNADGTINVINYTAWLVKAAIRD